MMKKSLMTCLHILTQYHRVTDRQMDGRTSCSMVSAMHGKIHAITLSQAMVIDRQPDHCPSVL